MAIYYKGNKITSVGVSTSGTGREQVIFQYADFSKFPTTATTKAIYIDLSTKQAYFWNGASYIVIDEDSKSRIENLEYNLNEANDDISELGNKVIQNEENIKTLVKDVVINQDDMNADELHIETFDGDSTDFYIINSQNAFKLGGQEPSYYAKASDVEEVRNEKANVDHTHSEYLTEHQSLEDYASKQWVEEKQYITEHQDISHKANADEVYTKEAIDVLLIGKANSNHKHSEYANVDHKHDEYLTQHQDLSHKADVNSVYNKDETNELLNNKANVDHKHDEYLLKEYKPNYKSLVGQETKTKWVGTPLVNDEVVENIYINTNLSADEVENILNAFEITTGKYFYIYNTNGSIIAEKPNTKNWRIQEEFSSNNYIFYGKDAEDGSYKAGWQTNVIVNPITINGTIKSFVTDDDLKQLSSLFSTTPFKEVETTILYELNEDGTINRNKPLDNNIGKDTQADLSNLYILINNKVEKEEGKGLSSNDFTNEEKEKLDSLNNYDDTQLKEQINNVYTKEETNELINNAKPNIDYKSLVGQETISNWKGTPVASDGYVEGVYINTNLSIEKVNSICSTLTFTTRDEKEEWICCTDATLNHSIKITRNSNEDYSIKLVKDNGSWDENIFSSLNGWIHNIEYFEFKMENRLENLFSKMFNYAIENEKVTELFSATPFEEEKETILYELKDDGSLNKEKPIDTANKEEMESALGNKVDKVEGKDLSSNDFTTEEKEKLAGLENYNDAEVRNLIDGKVDKIEGKQLSTNDLTNELLEKLNSLSNYDDSEIQKQIDEIKTILTSDDVDLNELQELVNALKNNTANINDIFAAISTKANASDLVAHISNEENHITNEERIAWNNKSNFSGNYNDLVDKPTIPTTTEELENNSGFLTQHQDISHKANQVDLEQTNNSLNNKVDKSELNNINNLIETLTNQIIALTNEIEVLKVKNEVLASRIEELAQGSTTSSNSVYAIDEDGNKTKVYAIDEDGNKTAVIYKGDGSTTLPNAVYGVDEQGNSVEIYATDENGTTSRVTFKEE